MTAVLGHRTTTPERVDRGRRRAESADAIPPVVHTDASIALAFRSRGAVAMVTLAPSGTCFSKWPMASAMRSPALRDLVTIQSEAMIEIAQSLSFSSFSQSSVQ